MYNIQSDKSYKNLFSFVQLNQALTSEVLQRLEPGNF